MSESNAAIVTTAPPADFIDRVLQRALWELEGNDVLFNIDVPHDRHVNAVSRGGVEAIVARECDIQVWGVLFGLIWSDPEFKKWGNRPEIPGADAGNKIELCSEIADRAWIKVIDSEEFHTEAPRPGVLREADPIRWEIATEEVAA